MNFPKYFFQSKSLSLFSMYCLSILFLVKSTAASFTGLELQLDTFPLETYWELKTYPAMQYVDGRESNFYVNPNTEVRESFAIQAGEYHFEIYDTAGDGICCEYGNGFYNIIVNDHVVFVGDGDFGMSHGNNFMFGGSSSDNAAAGSLSAG
eukprot:UN08934